MNRVLLLLLLWLAPFPSLAVTSDVLSFGAVCDGLTNDTVGVQAAITATCVSGGGSVVFPAGMTCRVSSTLSETCSNLYLVGGGPGSSRLMLDFAVGSGVVFGQQTADVVDVGIRGLTILAGQTRTSGPSVLFDGTQRASLYDSEILGAAVGVQVGSWARPGRTIITRINNCRIDSTVGNGISAVGYAGLWVRDVHMNGVSGNGTSGILAQGPMGMDSMFIDNLVTENYDTGIFLAGVYGYNNANIEIRGGMLAWVRTAGVRIDGAANKVMVSDLEITGDPSIGSSVGVLVLDYGSYRAQRVSVSGLHMTKLRQEGIVLSGTAADVILSGNVIVDCALAGPRSGMAIYGTTNASIFGNLIDGAFDHALSVYAPSSAVHIHGNLSAGISSPYYVETGAQAWLEDNH